MRKIVPLIAIPFLSIPVIPSVSYAAACPPKIVCTFVDPAHGIDHPRVAQGCIKPACNTNVQLAQYVPTQYYPAQMMGGGGSPVIVPPTVINTQGYEHNSSKKSCKESMIDLFLFSVRRTTGDCTP